MAASALEIIPLDEMKAELGLPVSISSRDATIRRNIEAGVSSIATMTALPLIREQDVWLAAEFPPHNDSLDLPYEHVTGIQAIAYWRASDNLRHVPTGAIDVTALGALRSYQAQGHNGTLVSAPDAGWPETHAERKTAIVTMQREVAVPPALRQCAVLAARDFFEGQRNRPANDAIEILARPWIPAAHPNALERLDRAAAGLGQAGQVPVRGVEPAPTSRNLLVSIVDGGGVQSGSATSWGEVSGGSWMFTVTPVAAAPFIKIELPAGESLDGIVDTVDGDITADFDRQGATQSQSWVSSIEFDGPTRIMIVHAS